MKENHSRQLFYLIIIISIISLHLNAGFPSNENDF